MPSATKISMEASLFYSWPGLFFIGSLHAFKEFMFTESLCWARLFCNWEILTGNSVMIFSPSCRSKRVWRNFFLWNINYILKNVGNQTGLVPIHLIIFFCLYSGSQWERNCLVTIILQNINLLCSTEERKSHDFGKKWGWVNVDRFFISGWTTPLKRVLLEEVLTIITMNIIR